MAINNLNYGLTFNFSIVLTVRVWQDLKEDDYLVSKLFTHNAVCSTIPDRPGRQLLVATVDTD